MQSKEDKVEQSLGFTPNPSMDNPILYNNWKIYRWTGWKGLGARGKFTSIRIRAVCRKCGVELKDGDDIFESQGWDDPTHYSCSGDDGTVVGQWLAVKGEFPKREDSDEERARKRRETLFAYASCPGGTSAYERCEALLIEPQYGQKKIYYYTPDEEKDAVREEGLRRLKEWIDQYELSIA